MSEFKGTKGPWFGLKGGRYDNSKNTWDLHNHDEGAACSESAPITTKNGDIVAFVVHSSDEYHHSPVIDDNARLIAAAPDLLEALQDSVDRMKSQLILLKCDDEFINSETEMARAAIAKAIGTECSK